MGLAFKSCLVGRRGRGLSWTGLQNSEFCILWSHPYGNPNARGPQNRIWDIAEGDWNYAYAFEFNKYCHSWPMTPYIHLLSLNWFPVRCRGNIVILILWSKTLKLRESVICDSQPALNPSVETPNAVLFLLGLLPLLQAPCGPLCEGVSIFPVSLSLY